MFSSLNSVERWIAVRFSTYADPPPLNPLYVNGIHASKLGLTVLKDPTQHAASSIIEQVAQVTLLRVVIPWMIGKAFERVGDLLGPGVKAGIAKLFSNYNFTAKTWAGLTKNEDPPASTGNRTSYAGEPEGLLKRGALRYQILVPSYTWWMFAFFLVLTVGWLFVAERRQGTPLCVWQAAPLTRGQLLLGKFLPCLLLSLFQGVFLLAAGNVVFGMALGLR